ncbi:alpha-taxilin-like isoform X1 [Haliotis rufescens]|uniref:alpha-taxilin-like isoform X1 n=1 Tax=Haliotis rufescens TaxID=6454 RepID=UPI00201F165D|nr:alpha-taxilin-like isoform X1 [Haliotis rufescens]
MTRRRFRIFRCCFVSESDEPSKETMDTAVEQVQEQPSSTTPSVEAQIEQREVTPVVSEKEEVAVPDSTSEPKVEGDVDTNGDISDEGLNGDMEDLSLNRESESPETTPAVVDSTQDTKTDKSKSQNSKVSSTTVAKGDSKSDSSSSKPSGKSKKKEDKSIEHILRALNSLHTTEEKLAALCKKYADLHEEHRVLQASFKQAQRKMVVTVREKDQLQSEHTKAVMAKSKLESLCRELQKHNRVIKEESLARAREEDEKRKEISNKFQQTIGEIQSQMTDNHERNIKLREDNTELAGKLKKFVEQYELREQQVEKIVQHRELEKQLGEAKLAQANAMLKELEERSGKEREFLLLQTAEAQKKSQVLETQLTMYKERYEEFQSTINRSNEMFQKFKTEMDKMGKRIRKLEKEGAQWKAKWESSNRALIGMAEEKTKYDKEKGVLLTKVSKLESLCRALQSELHGKKSTAPSAAVSDDLQQANGDKGEPTATPPNTPETTSRNSPVKDEEAPSDSGEATPPVPPPSSSTAEQLATESKPSEQKTQETAEVKTTPEAGNTSSKETVTENTSNEKAVSVVTENALNNESVSENASKQEAVTENASKQEAVTENASKQEAVAGNASKQEAVTGNASKQEAVTGNASKQEAVTENASKKEGVTENAEEDEYDITSVD